MLLGRTTQGALLVGTPNTIFCCTTREFLVAARLNGIGIWLWVMAHEDNTIDCKIYLWS